MNFLVIFYKFYEWRMFFFLISSLIIYKCFSIKLARKLEEAINQLFRFHSFFLRSVSPSLILVSLYWFCLIFVIILFTQCMKHFIFYGLHSTVQYFLLVSRLYSVIFYISSYYDIACVWLAIELVILIY